MMSKSKSFSSTEFMSSTFDQSFGQIESPEPNKLSTISIKNKSLSSLSNTVSFEGTLLYLMDLILNYRNSLSIEDNKFIIKEANLELLEKINYCMEFLCNIPFSFEFNDSDGSFYFDFSHLDEEIQNLTHRLFLEVK